MSDVTDAYVLIREKRARESGALVQLLGSEVPMRGKLWLLRCAEHDVTKGYDRQIDAIADMRYPTSWCAGCRT